MGGISCPPVEAVASTAPAKCGLYPVFFIKGIVKEPVVTTFATELPLTVPMRPLDITATFAGPPIALPVNALAMSINNSPSPVFSDNAPNKRKA